MSLRFYDTASAQVRDFEPLVPGQVSLYYCGATVQGLPHVGHIRSAIAFDQLTRWLQARGFRVTTVRNVTDIDDKILAKAAASVGAEASDGVVPDEQWWALAYRFEQEFSRAYDTLGVQRPTCIMHARPGSLGQQGPCHQRQQHHLDVGQDGGQPGAHVADRVMPQQQVSGEEDPREQPGAPLAPRAGTEAPILAVREQGQDGQRVDAAVDGGRRRRRVAEPHEDA